MENTVHDVEVDDKRQAARLREEKLQSDIFILKKLNAAFESFNGALQDTGSANERVAAQVEQTDALLNKYIDILSKSEEFARLIFDDQWEGAQADEEFLERERTEAIERARKEAEEEEARRKREEQAKFEQERQERLKREEKERLEREKSERAIRGGVRGVRGTRASTLGRGAAFSRADAHLLVEYPKDHNLCRLELVAVQFHGHHVPRSSQSRITGGFTNLAHLLSGILQVLNDLTRWQIRSKWPSNPLPLWPRFQTNNFPVPGPPL
ncbi:hypothetical protein CPB84DRAFT_309500 [Gymnopilus junonius]|uniref:DASH complex subunit DUO1 n=1 Tax=Gymnopilus junonius TaxID=109634 RepID=A0A9P5NUV0_GYMJU|nr:hypothetical protein CPB84DRAFT_309500 [Gymnopilus junonius]